MNGSDLRMDNRDCSARICACNLNLSVLEAAGAGGVLGSFVILIQTEMRIQNFPRYEEQVRKKWGLPPEK